MVQSSQSSPGQFAAALKRAAEVSRTGHGVVPPELTGIQHGHENDGEPEKPKLTNADLFRVEIPEG